MHDKSLIGLCMILFNQLHVLFFPLNNINELRDDF